MPNLAMNSWVFLETKVDPTEVRDEIEDFDEKVALVKAKLDLENSEEAKAVEAVMAGLKERYSEYRPNCT